MNNRKIVALLLVLTLFALMAMGSGSTDSSDTSSVQSATTKVEPTPAVTIPETVVLDQNGIKVTATGFDTKSVFGPEVKFLIENNSSLPITVQARNVSVNGYMMDTMMSSDVAVGKKANDGMTISSSSLEDAGITTIADIEFQLHIFNSETWDGIMDSDIIRLETSEASGYSYSYDNSGNQVYNENGIEIVIKGLDESNTFIGPSVIVYIDNESAQDITVQARDVSINGFMVDSIFSSDVTVGKHTVDRITFLSNELEENGIEKIEDIELSFHIFNMNSWDDIVDVGPISLTF